jgi:hypothetical protein
MPRSKERAGDPAPNESDNDSNQVQITRRDAIISAVAAGVATSVGSGVAVAAGTIDTTIEGWPANGAEIYNQYEDADLAYFRLGSGTTMSIDYDPIDDDYIIGEVALKVNDGNYSTFGDARTDTVNPDGGTVQFNADELWGDENGVVESGEHFDFRNLNIVDPDNDGDYDELTFTPPDAGDPDGETLAVANDITLRFRFVSANGTLNEQKELMFTMGIGIPLGFGQSFGANFGKDHVESWPADWNA